jgi:hypothetical protein
VRVAGAASGVAVALVTAAGPAALGQVTQPGQDVRAVQRAQARGQVSVFIESMSPRWATPGRTVTVSGIARNTTRVPQPGLAVQLRSSAAQLRTRDDLALYAAGQYPVDMPVGTAVPLPGVLAPGGTLHWQATFQPSALGVSQAGVYPLAAQVLNLASLPLSTDHTFLPFWPGGPRSLHPQPLKIAWLWPLIDQPYQAACPALLTNDLAKSLAARGRLGGLLAAGGAYSSAAKLTWAIDPALLQNVQTMTGRYGVGGRPGCGGADRLPASRSARAWLSGLLGAISGGEASGQQVFLTPYADVDVAALSHYGLDADLSNAYAEGRAVGRQILHRPAGSDNIAWPPGGVADSGVLGSLAVNGISTVLLDATMMPPSGQIPYYTPSAQTSAPSGVGSSLRILLTDDTITRILGSGSATSANPGTTFAAGQRFLAETAMIVAEAPNIQRSIVIAPPRRWDPAPGLASELLSESTRAPWLRPVSAAALAAASHPSGQVSRLPPPAHRVTAAELNPAFLGQVKSLDATIRLQASIFSPPDPSYLSAGVAAVESSAWRGRSQARVREQLLARVAGYVAAQDRRVTIIDSGQITLGGSSGKVPVSIFNSLPQDVQVRLHISVPADGRLVISRFNDLVPIPAGKTVTIRVQMHAPTVGVTDVTLGLRSPDGRPLPGTAVRLTVHATRFGTLALVIVCVALGVFVLTSSARAFRRARREQAQGDTQSPDAPGAAAAAGSVVSDEPTHADQPPEDPDEYADARGRASR